MALSGGDRLGPYEIVSPLGAGGMGEVYRARDTRLERTVAIKILNSQIVANPELRARFEREAKIISQLQHPNICVLHDIGSENGTDFLVMEYLEGESLADRLRKGPLPVNELLKIATHLADALERAHRAGIVHRDLKPGNVMLTRAGAKLLDFGLAKPLTATVSASVSNISQSVLTAALTQGSPGPSPGVALSGAGSVLGTVPYMAPEQIQGQPVDARSDIFSFGVVLYEMATGKRAFEGKTPASIVGQILAVDPPPPSTLRPELLPGLDRIIAICLDKDPDERFQSAHDLKLQLQMVGEAAVARAANPGTRGMGSAIWIPTVAIALLAIMATAYFAWQLTRPKPVYWSTLLPPDKTILATSTTTAAPPMLSPDGTRLVFGAVDEKRTTMLYVQPLNASAAHVLKGTEGARYPFWSPDSADIGFFAQGQLKRIPADGGPVQTLAPVPDARGGSWGPDGTIVFSPAATGGLMRVPAGGGTPSPLTKIGRDTEASQRWPAFLPDGKHVIFSTVVNGESTLSVADLASGASHPLSISAGNAVFANGRLLYVHDGTLVAQPFSPSKLAPTGDFVPVAEHILENLGVFYDVFTASQNGTLVYALGEARGVWDLQWVDRDGKPSGTLGEPAPYTFPSISYDGKRVAVAISSDIWVVDLQRGTRTRITFDGKSNEPIWTPDGKQIIFAANHAGRTELYIKASDNSGSEQQLTTIGATYPQLSGDGRYVVFMHEGSNTGWDVWGMDLSDHKTFPVFQSPANDLLGTISPDSRWVAFASNESGTQEVYITSFQAGGAKWQVSTGGGLSPHWRGDGKELYFFSGDQIMGVDVSTTANSVTLGKPHALFSARLRPAPNGSYDVTRDGKRFLLNTAPVSGNASAPLTLVVNWPELLKK